MCNLVVFRGFENEKVIIEIFVYNIMINRKIFSIVRLCMVVLFKFVYFLEMNDL